MKILKIVVGKNSKNCFLFIFDIVVVFNIYLDAEHVIGFHNCIGLQNFEKSGGESQKRIFFPILNIIVIFNVYLVAEHDTGFENCLAGENFKKKKWGQRPKKWVFSYFRHGSRF